MTEHISHQDSLQKIITDTKKLLAFHDACKLDYPLTEELQKFLHTGTKKYIHVKAPARPPEKDRFSLLTLSDLKGEIKTCTCCSLQQRKGRVLLDENQKRRRPDLLIVCDWDIADERNPSGLMSDDAKDLLTKMLAAIQLTWEDVCICPIVKCPPPANKEPSEEEIQSCLPFLKREIELLKPKVICAMGKISSQQLLNSSKQLFALRGKFQSLLNIPLMPTFHPALLLKHPELKNASWQDLQLIRHKINTVS